jgi:hypothetical protein
MEAQLADQVTVTGEAVDPSGPSSELGRICVKLIFFAL